MVLLGCTTDNMRLWTIHPKYLDASGLVALWREALLARAVVRGRTRGYRHHPQLQRFRECLSPHSALNGYLAGVYAESVVRGYEFNITKLTRVAVPLRIRTTDGQLRYEWEWLLHKLRARSPALYRAHRSIVTPDAHPLFLVVVGPISEWERVIEPRAA